LSLIKRNIIKAIFSLEKLLNSKENKELSYQLFFEENPVVFDILGYKSAIPFTKANNQSFPKDRYTGLKPEPDFIAQNKNSLYEIFEVKTPFSKKIIIDSNKYRERFAAEVISYIKQTIVYEDYFSRNPENRIAFKNKFGLDIQEDLDIKIIIGLNTNFDKRKVHKECRAYKYKIDIISFDEILERLKSEYIKNYGEFEGVDGAVFFSVLKLFWQNKIHNQYIFDFGESTIKNRFSLYLTPKKELCFRIIDEGSKVHIVPFNLVDENILDKEIYLFCEYGVSPLGFVMILDINGIELYHNVFGSRISIAFNLEKGTIGSSIEKKDNAKFEFYELGILEKTTTYKEKYQLLNYFNSTYGLII